MLNLSNTVIIIIAIAICGVIVAAIVIYRRRRRQNRGVEQSPWSADSKIIVTPKSSSKDIINITEKYFGGVRRKKRKNRKAERRINC
jgi:FtsZ-interacting cell division protein ZipA